MSIRLPLCWRFVGILILKLNIVHNQDNFTVTRLAVDNPNTNLMLLGGMKLTEFFRQERHH